MSMKEDGRLNLRSLWNGQGRYIDNEVNETTWYYMALKSALIMAKLIDNTNDIIDIQKKLIQLLIILIRIFGKVMHTALNIIGMIEQMDWFYYQVLQEKTNGMILFRY